MKVIKCSQNNLARPLFGMIIDFHSDDMTTVGAKLPNYYAVDYARQLANFGDDMQSLRPSTVFLKYTVPIKKSGLSRIFGFFTNTTDTWRLVSGKLQSAAIRIPRGSKAHGEIAAKLVTAAKEIAQMHHRETAMASWVRAGRATIAAGGRVIT